jgi:rhodanese-related sulfurtransferase
MASITTTELARLVDDDDVAPFVFDVRAPDAFARWQIEGKSRLAALNVPYWTALEGGADLVERIPDDRDVVVVCAHGGSSDLVVETLGLPNLRNLEGGMDAWAMTLVPHTLWDDGTHFVWQFDRIAKACLSYGVGARGGRMAVVDPAGDLDPYRRAAEEMSCEITDVFDTHLHADHVSIARLLCDATGAT